MLIAWVEAGLARGEPQGDVFIEAQHLSRRHLEAYATLQSPYAARFTD